MEPIAKRLGELRDEVGASTVVEKAKERIEFMSSLMAGHQHRISLFIKKSRISGTTERVQGHVHKVDLPVDGDGDVLGYTTTEDNHKHRIKFRLKIAEASTEEEKKK